MTVAQELMDINRTLGSLESDVKTNYKRFEEINVRGRDFAKKLDDIDTKVIKQGEQLKQLASKMIDLHANNGHYTIKRKALNYGGPTLTAGAVFTLLNYVIPLIKG